MAEFNRQDTFDKVAKIIADKLSIDTKTISGTATLQDLGADSLDIVEIIMKMEEQLGVMISDEQAEKLQTVDDVVGYVHSLRNK
ncbi:MAG TPA: acyl carrier protein [Candidatus Dependentiae bacterium]|nr:acyl carrier protein [Candidatus Dependentiae bacterium]HRQ62544.1 acyl carrier protein [Candidatus Dependentiae bacterium]